MQQAVNEKDAFYKWAAALAIITIVYNIIEGCVSVLFGLQDETLALFAFGMDSYVEVISGVGIWHMVYRMKQADVSNHDAFEQTALRITGWAFYCLAVGLLATASVDIYTGKKPETTFWGIVVSAVSIMSMWLLIHYKTKIGRQYNSQALIADANCSKACMYFSVVLIISSIGYETTGFGAIDSIGAVGIAILSYREGREAFAKSKGSTTCSCQGDCH
ncbi:MAG: cation transporter [Nitrospirae bacterium]|uniref:cation transporter n=1 Tax=Candidatus Magnetobacterium casense TaxID=1455061 RepID=UPI00058D2BF7|nr:cation transporter [Candidatus Magnetobacterium casensis]MBF0336533.1 cation transporter [Nitrospirota bacterium]